MELLKRDDVRAHVQIYPQQQPEGGFHGFRFYDDWDKIFIHHAGLRGPSRLWLIENLVRLADLPAALRVKRRACLGPLLNRLRLFGEGVEIGVAAGDFSKVILDVWEGRLLHLVDAWRHLPDCNDVTNVTDEEHQALRNQLPDKLAAHQGRFRVHAMMSSEAAGNFPDSSLDFIYLDAGKSYDAVIADLRLWYRKLRPGGVFAGHDFLDGELPQGTFGVRSAVEQFEREKGLRAAVTTEQEWPSWYFIKP